MSAIRTALPCRVVACLAAACLVWWLGAGRVLGQSAARRVNVAGVLALAVPAALQEAAAPDAPSLPGRVEHFFTDLAPQPLLLWVQSVPPQGPSSLPLSEQALEQVAGGFVAGLSGVHQLRVGPYDPERGALRFQFEARATSAGAVPASFAGVAFLTRSATVLAVCAAPSERAADLRAAAELLWEQSRVNAAALAPTAPEAAFGVGRYIGIVLGSLLGGVLLTWALSALLVKVKLTRPSAVAISGLVLVGSAALVVMLHGSPEAVLQLVSYVLVGGVCYARLPRWLAARRGPGLLRDQRGLSTVEYVIILVLVAVVAIVAWHAFGDSVRSKLAGANGQLSDALNTSEEAAGTSVGAARPASSGGTSRAIGGGNSGGSSRAIASGAGRPLAGTASSGTASSGTASSAPPGGATSQQQLATGNAASTPAPASSGSSTSVASTVAPASSPPSFWQQAKDYVHESAPVQTALGIGYGTLQSIAPGGFLMPSPGPKSRAFEAGRGIGQLATGITQVITGAGMMGGGGAATVAGGAGAIPTGGTSLVVSGAGLAVAAEGAVVAGVGATNVVAGVDTLTNAVSMSGSPPGSGGPPPATTTPAPASGVTPPAPPPPGPAATPPVPPKAQTVLGQVRGSGGGAPAGYRGGGPFANDGRAGGQVLPKSDAAGKSITYREYDVNRFQPGVNRGAERIVVGSDGKAYYTSDHYRTFTPIP